MQILDNARFRHSEVLASLVVFVVFLGGAELGYWLSDHAGPFATFWPNSGLYLALLMRTPPRRWSTIVLAGVSSNLVFDSVLHGKPFLAACGFATANTAEALIGGLVVRWFFGSVTQLDNLKRVLGSFAVAATVSTPIGAALGAATANQLLGSSFWLSWRVWWIADALGVLLATPLVLSCLDRRIRFNLRAWIDGALIFAGLVLTGSYVFEHAKLPPIVLLVFLLWAAIRLGIPGVAFTSFILSVMAVRHTVLGIGAFANVETPLESVVEVQLYCAVAAFVMHAFAAVLEERRQAEALLETHVQERTAQLIEQRERLQTTLASIVDGVVTTDTAGRITDMNPAAETMTGWLRSQAVGHPLDDVVRLVDESSFQPIKNLGTLVFRENDVVRSPHRGILLSKGTIERTIESTAAPIRGKRGGILGSVVVMHDITDRRRAERQLEEQNSFIQAIHDNATDLIFVKDVQLRLTYANAATLRVLGMTREEAIMPTEIQQFSNRSELDHIASNDRRVLDTGETIVDEEPYTCADGVTRVFLSTKSPLRDGHGQIHGVIGISRDVTEQREAQQRLRVSEERLRLALDTETMGLWDWDIITGKVIWSESHFVILGYPIHPHGEATYEMWSSRVHPDDRERVFAALQEAKENRVRFSMEHRVTRADNGAVVWLLPIGHFHYNAAGQAIRLTGVFFNITSQKEVEQRLRESEAFNRSLMDGSADCVAVLDIHGRLQHINSFGLCLMEIDDARSVLGKEWLTWISSSARGDWNRAIEMARKGKSHSLEIFAPTANGKPKWWDIMVSPVRDREGGPVVRLLAVSRDITRRKEVEAKLQEADRQKDEFLATLAHELRNPLAPIRNGLEIMKIACDDAEVIEQSRSLIERQLEQMVTLVNDLMDVSRITRGKVVLNKEPVLLSVVISSAIETSRPLIEQMRHELSITWAEPTVMVNADVTRLAQVFVNLLNNSAKYMDQGGHIWLAVERQGSDVVVSVRDKGIGITSDQLPLVFRMFSQVDRSLEKSQGGLGIGLTLAKRLVEMHEGMIEARSEGLGKGSEFIVRLPAIVETSSPEQVEYRPSKAESSSLRILVVDDNQDGADSLSMMLKLSGNEVQTVYDGQSALAAAEQFLPHAILLDIGLPGLNGYEVCRQIRQKPFGTEVVIIAQTGWGTDEDRQRADEAGFDYHMTKPIDPQVIMRIFSDLNHDNRSETRVGD